MAGAARLDERRRREFLQAPSRAAFQVRPRCYRRLTSPLFPVFLSRFFRPSLSCSLPILLSTCWRNGKYISSLSRQINFALYLTKVPPSFASPQQLSRPQFSPLRRTLAAATKPLRLRAVPNMTTARLFGDAVSIAS